MYSPAKLNPAFFSESRPFLPTGIVMIFLPLFARKNSLALRRMFALKAPARPRSPRHHDGENILLFALRHQRIRDVLNSRHHRPQQSRQLLRIRTRRQCRFLRTTQPRRRDKLHRARDLLAALHRPDAAPKIEKCWHSSLRLSAPRYFAAATASFSDVVNRCLNSSTAFLISPLIASSRAFFSLIDVKIPEWLVSTN